MLFREPAIEPEAVAYHSSIGKGAMHGKEGPKCLKLKRRRNRADRDC